MVGEMHCINSTADPDNQNPEAPGEAGNQTSPILDEGM